MIQLRLVGVVVGVCLYGSCMTGLERKAPESRYYKNVHVRQCLKVESRQKATEAKVCWAELLGRLRRDEQFLAQSDLTSIDIVRIRSNAAASRERSEDLSSQLSRCHSLPIQKRQERLVCLRTYLDKHQNQLSLEEIFEVETAIIWLKEALMRLAGKIKHTIEHASFLLGAKLHLEDEGVRIDKVFDGPILQAQFPEQGMIIALDGIPLVELDPAERIAHLEACQERPINMLARKGDIGGVLFVHSRLSCNTKSESVLINKFQVEPKLCSEATSLELSFGISWCYLARDGILEVVEVCRDSPADIAGVIPGHRYTHINGVLVLGKSYQQILDQLSVFPEKALHFKALGSFLDSPRPLVGQALTKEKVNRFWQAILDRIKSEKRKQRKP